MLRPQKPYIDRILNGSHVLIFHGNLNIYEPWFTLSCYGVVDIQSSFSYYICVRHVRQPAKLSLSFKETGIQCGCIYLYYVQLKMDYTRIAFVCYKHSKMY